MIVETLAAEKEVNSDKAAMGDRLKGEIPTNGKRTETFPEISVEAGVITHPNAGTVENMATMKRSAGKRLVTRSQLADSSQITLLTPTTTIVAECP